MGLNVKIIGSAAAAVVLGGLVAKRRRAKNALKPTPVHMPPKKVSQRLSENKEKKQARAKNKKREKAPRTRVDRLKSLRHEKAEAQRMARRANNIE